MYCVLSSGIIVPSDRARTSDYSCFNQSSIRKQVKYQQAWLFDLPSGDSEHKGQGNTNETVEENITDLDLKSLAHVEHYVNTCRTVYTSRYQDPTGNNNF